MTISSRNFTVNYGLDMNVGRNLRGEIKFQISYYTMGREGRERREKGREKLREKDGNGDSSNNNKNYNKG